ncbi:MAG: DUF2892 domain-containing protein [Candidatus Woesearchaeota archaeon]
MNQNIGLADRLIRLILTIVFVILGFVYSYWWFIPAVILLINAIIGWCGLYSLLRWSTYAVETKPAAKKAAPKKTAKKKKK